MNIIKASEHNIKPNCDVTVELNALLESLRGDNQAKTLQFENAVYYIDSNLCVKRELHITNTAGEKEYKSGETPCINEVPFYLNDIHNLVIDGCGATFVIDGKVTNIAVERCENITFRNLSIKYSHPDMHEFKVSKVTPFSVEWDIDDNSNIQEIGGDFAFVGRNYVHPFKKYQYFSWAWIGCIRQDNPDNIRRVFHPLFKSIKTTRIGERKFKTTYFGTRRFKVGDKLYLYDVRRQYAGIFATDTKNLVLDNIRQHFNYSLAIVVQNCENIDVVNSTFAPADDSKVMMASVADFIQMCSCRGLLNITGNLFDGAGDDCLNVHGIHFKIVSKDDNKIVVRFMHPQTYGFNPLNVGDDIAFINIDSMLETGRTKILSSTLVGKYDIELELQDASGAIVGEAVEDISSCPDVIFKDNTLNRIITRGLLLTTRGKVLVENNHFKNNSMSGILLSDDARGWYESGMCCDVTIKGNTFDYCGGTPILILPENKVHKGAVHKNIVIENNHFNDYHKECIYAKSTDNIRIQNNTYKPNNKKLVLKNCTNVDMKD